MTKHLHIITGGPGSGKTSLVDALSEQGIRRMPEAGRAIIQDQVAIGGTALPWADKEAFANLMLAWEMRSFRETVNARGPIVFDRGIPDVIGYLRLCGLAVPASTIKAAELLRYANRVFIAPPLARNFCAGRRAEADVGGSRRHLPRDGRYLFKPGIRACRTPSDDCPGKGEIRSRPDKLAVTARPRPF